MFVFRWSKVCKLPSAASLFLIASCVCRYPVGDFDCKEAGWSSLETSLHSPKTYPATLDAAAYSAGIYMSRALFCRYRIKIRAISVVHMFAAKRHIECDDSALDIDGHQIARLCQISPVKIS